VAVVGQFELRATEATETPFFVQRLRLGFALIGISPIEDATSHRR
jgi:hypothetical protein